MVPRRSPAEPSPGLKLPRSATTSTTSSPTRYKPKSRSQIFTLTAAVGLAFLILLLSSFTASQTPGLFAEAAMVTTRSPAPAEKTPLLPTAMDEKNGLPAAQRFHARSTSETAVSKTKLAALAALCTMSIWGCSQVLEVRNSVANDVKLDILDAAQEQNYWTTSGWTAGPLGGTVPQWRESYEKAAKLVGKMTLIEKVNITSGIGWSQGLCVGNTAPAELVGFPGLCLQDGPLGLRFADNATAWPAGITVGATWDRSLMRARGAMHAREAKGKGVNVLLGPSMGPIGRQPGGGRGWEGFGSDPFLQGVAAGETIRGIQGEGVIATAKHWVANEQEHFRQRGEWEGVGTVEAVSSNLEGRTLREFYAWPFYEAVKAGVGSVMCSYNRVNQTYACGNSHLLNGLLKTELGFQGFVMSDWYAQREGFHSILAGLDMGMPGEILVNTPGQTLFASELTKSVMNGSVPLERLDDMAMRIVAAYYQVGQDDPKRFPVRKPNFSSWTREEKDVKYHGAGEGEEVVVNQYVDVREDHHLLARQIAVDGTVLVKNVDNILPLPHAPDAWTGKSIGLYGEDLGDPLQPGYPNFCPDRGCNKGSLGSGYGSGAVEFETFSSPLTVLTSAFTKLGAKVSSIPSNHPSALPTIAADAGKQDLCLIFINADAGEGFIVDPVSGWQGDRLHLNPQNNGEALVQTIAKACDRSIVILHTVGPTILESFISHPSIRAVLIAHLPGQESGSALEALLFGHTSPSGKLPYTIARSASDYGPHSSIIATPNAEIPQSTFYEGLLVDYRRFDYYNITPRYAFGFGLTYTRFSLSSPSLTTILPRTPDGLPPPPPEPLEPITLASEIPSAIDVLFPKNFGRRFKNYFYPYLTSTDEIRSKNPLPRPDGYTRTPAAPGPGEGGNPALWDVIARVEATLSNTGEREGREVIQVYVELPEDETDKKIVVGGEKDQSMGITPKRVLRGFEKVGVEKGGKVRVGVDLRRRDLSYWDVVEEEWVVPKGGIKIWVGTSSAVDDLQLAGVY